MGRFRAGVRWYAVAALLAAATPGLAQESFDFRVVGGDAKLSSALEAASAIRAAQAEKTTSPLDIYAAARAEYGRMLSALYAAGYYSGVVNVRIDGREAAEIAPLDAPARIGRVEVVVTPGAPFVFGRAQVAPLPDGALMPEDFGPGLPAPSGVVQGAVAAGIDAWRERGHPKADVASEDIVADHKANTLSVDVALSPGPFLRFGMLNVSGQQRMKLSRILAIAGLPEGKPFSPDDMAKVEERLRRAGVFSSIVLTEDEGVTPPDLQDISLVVAEDKLRRYTFGAEIASFDGATITGSWTHRNLWGGAERLTIAGAIEEIGSQISGTDYILGVTLDRPATFGPDNMVSGFAEIAHLSETGYTQDGVKFGVLGTRYVSRRLTVSGGITYENSRVYDDAGETTYTTLSLPLGAMWETRDDPLDARKGHFIDLEVSPFVGFNGAESGTRVTADARIFRSFGERDRVTLAGRFQLGKVSGPSLLGTPRDYLFYSGGGGTVRGFPYQSLGVTVNDNGTDIEIGGQAFLGASAEVRVRATDTIGVVAFVDWGQVGATAFGEEGGGYQTGAGLGVRYDVGFAPLRLDIATPVSGDGGDGVQFYIGIGQAF